MSILLKMYFIYCFKRMKALYCNHERMVNLCKIAPECQLKGVLYEALQAYLNVLDQYTLDDFLHSKEKLMALLLGK